MPTFAILPIKFLAAAKQRLAYELSPGPRQALAEAMYADVLVALRRSTVDQVLVVTADHGAQQIAAGHGASVLQAPERGHDDAATLGIGAALEAGADRALLVPGDCPLLSVAELDGLLARPAPGGSAVGGSATGGWVPGALAAGGSMRGGSVLIVPDRHRTGTNALLLSPPDSLAPAFGPDSRTRHAANAESAGARHEIVEVASLALDIDTPEDLATLEEALEASHGGAANTRGMLRQLRRSRT
ncbi:MAG: NTP transferase domain-containing protein [Solirubrobacteraceae bacterium]